MKRSAIMLALLGLLVPVCHASTEDQGPWKRHTIDNTSKGADGVRLADINGDGLMDIVTGWEEGGVVRLYINPGHEKSKEKWPAVTVGKVNNVEDAVMVDLDNDGTLDVVSSCEGNTKTMYVHWGPKDKTKLLDPDAWVTETIPATAGLQIWMYCLPMDVDQKNGVDLVVGSKNKGAAVGWLESPENPRDLAAWTYHKICDAGWIMSLEQSERGLIRAGVFVTDRKGSTRSAKVLYRDHGKWENFEIETGQAEYMFGAAAGDDVWFTATRDGVIKRFSYINYRDMPRMEIDDLPNPFDIKHGKAVAVGDIDSDTRNDVVVSFNTQGTTGKPGVAWMEITGLRAPESVQYRFHDISGPEGKKFDRIELIDLDGDGDLDVLTCEEVDNLGVIWYENPYGTQVDKQ